MESFTAKDLATLAGTDAKTFRRFIRAQAATDASVISACGQGNRYNIDANAARALVNAFEAWASRKRSSAPQRSIADLERALYGEQDA